MNLAVRPYIREDLPEIVRIQNEASPMHRYSLGELERDMVDLEPDLRHHFYVAEMEEAIKGVANVHRTAGMHHPQKFHAELYVPPQLRGNGVGRALYQTILDWAKPFDPISFLTHVSESDMAALSFAANRGFVEMKRDFVSTLEFSGFDHQRYRPLELKLEAEGVTFRTLTECDSVELRREWYEAFSEVRQDVPRISPPTPLTYEFFEKHVIEDQELLRAGTIFAFERGAMIGFSGVFEGATPGWVDQWLTGVRRPARGRGIATALKLRVIRAASALGFKTMQTENDTTNVAMLAVNEGLGFVRQPAVLTVVKTFREP